MFWCRTVKFAADAAWGATDCGVKRRFLDAGGGTGADADADADADVDSEGRLLLPDAADAADADAADAEGCCERFNRREGFPPGFAPEAPVGPAGPVGCLSDILCYALVEKGMYTRQAIPAVLSLSKSTKVGHHGRRRRISSMLDAMHPPT